MIKRFPLSLPRCRWRGPDGTPCSAESRFELRSADTVALLERHESAIANYCGRHIGSAERLQRAIERQQKGRFTAMGGSGGG